MSMNERMEMVKFTAKQIFLSRRTAVLMVLSFFPLVIIGVWMYQPDESASEFFSGVFLAIFLQFILLIIALLCGTALINSEIADKTISYLSTRSLRREELFLYRYLGSIPVGFLIIAVPIAVCLTVLDIHTGSLDTLEHLPDYCTIILLGVVVYSSFFAFLGVAIKRPLMVGLLFAFFWEILLANLPGKIPYMTLMFYLRSMSHHMADTPWPHQIEAFSTGMSALVLLGTAAVFLFLSIVIFRSKDLVE
ncbi:MAG: ABC transporter permease subunit [Candidatus Thermoplasmatota archaeon]|nr:ABC transporter permease subunit [Candidatus Thermoplasmatota archaeon]